MIPEDWYGVVDNEGFFIEDIIESPAQFGEIQSQVFFHPDVSGWEHASVTARKARNKNTSLSFHFLLDS